MAKPERGRYGPRNLRMSIMLPALKALVRQDASRNTCSRTMIRLGWRSGTRRRSKPKRR
jgi:hypothetical protein